MTQETKKPKETIYLFKGRLIQAATRQQAVCFVAQEEDKARIPSMVELLDLVGKGVKVEHANEVLG